MPLIAFTMTSQEAYSRRHRLYAKGTTSHTIHLKDKLSSISRGAYYVTQFILFVKYISNEL